MISVENALEIIREVISHERRKESFFSEEDPLMIGLAWSHPCQDGGRPEGWFEWVFLFHSRCARKRLQM